MTQRHTEFLVDLTGNAPRNLRDSIRRVQNASFGFREFWMAGEHADAYETSQEAFQHLDYIQNELLRQRDVLKENPSAWQKSPYKATLDKQVGHLVNGISAADSAWFVGLKQGAGRIPPTCMANPLTLEKALNKLKHRHTIALNFSLPPGGGHLLYVLTKAGIGQPDSLSEIDISTFCGISKVAASYV